MDGIECSPGGVAVLEDGAGIVVGGGGGGGAVPIAHRPSPKSVQLLNVAALGGVTRCILNSNQDSEKIQSQTPEAALHQLRLGFECAKKLIDPVRDGGGVGDSTTLTTSSVDVDDETGRGPRSQDARRTH